LKAYYGKAELEKAGEFAGLLEENYPKLVDVEA
jgi:hypothetical protein